MNFCFIDVELNIVISKKRLTSQTKDIDDDLFIVNETIFQFIHDQIFSRDFLFPTLFLRIYMFFVSYIGNAKCQLICHIIFIRFLFLETGKTIELTVWLMRHEYSPGYWV